MRSDRYKEEDKKAKKKKGGAREVAMRVIMFCLIGIILVSGYNIGKTVWDYMKARNAYKEVAETANVDPDQFTGVVDFDKLKEINPDIQAWIYQEGTIINYPVVRGDDNDKYLHTGFDGTWSGGGTLFVDYRNAADFEDFNTIIYGHHMRDGSMFRSLRGYTKESGYYDEHPTLELITPDEKYHLVIFSSYITEATGDAYTIDFVDDEEKQDFIDDAFSLSQLSLTQSDISVTSDDQIITLSTCAYDFDEARYVVICKLVPWTDEEVREGEETQKQIDAQK